MKNGYRDWKTFRSRLSTRISEAIIFGTVTAALVSLYGLLDTDNPWRGRLMPLAIFCVLAPIALAFLRAIPPRLPPPWKIRGTQLTLEAAVATKPTVDEVFGVVGPTLAGKSTLGQRLRHEPGEARTGHVHGYVISGNFEQHLLFLDGRGESLSDQFLVSDHVEHLVLILDHNAARSDRRILASRLETHAQYGQQLRSRVQEYNPHLRRVTILMNKRDLWQKNKAAVRQKVHSALAAEEENWRAAFPAIDVVARDHSNHSPEDIAYVMSRICQK